MHYRPMFPVSSRDQQPRLFCTFGIFPDLDRFILTVCLHQRANRVSFLGPEQTYAGAIIDIVGIDQNSLVVMVDHRWRFFAKGHVYSTPSLRR